MLTGELSWFLSRVCADESVSSVSETLLVAYVYLCLSFRSSCDRKCSKAVNVVECTLDRQRKGNIKPQASGLISHA
jgi:hypothetical protein